MVEIPKGNLPPAKNNKKTLFEIFATNFTIFAPAFNIFEIYNL